MRFEREGIEGLRDHFRFGRPPADGQPDTFRTQLIAQLDETPPDGYAKWNARLLAEALGMKADTVWKELRILGIHLQRRRS